MALSDKQISRIWDKHTIPVFDKTGINPIVFARAIEAEVRKDDTELIRQLVEAMGVATTPLAKDRQEVLRALAAGRARLDQPCG